VTPPPRLVSPRSVTPTSRSTSCDAELAAMLAPRTTQGPGSHWLDYASTAARQKIGGRDLGLIEPCGRCETVELWFDPSPNHQSQLIWLLDYFRSHPQMVARLRLRIVDYNLIRATTEELGRWKLADVDVTSEGISGDHAGSLLRSAQQGFERVTAAQARFNQFAERASVQFDRTWRHGNADA
jgi:hypothetical protein